MPERLSDNVHESLDSVRRFGNRLREAREEAGYTQIQLAEMSGYTNGWISHVERGTGTPTSKFAITMQKILGKDLYFSSVKLRPVRGQIGDDLVSATEAGEYVGLSRTRIYELMRRSDEIGNRHLPHVRVDGYRRIRVAELAKWIVKDGIERGDVVENFDDKVGEIEEDIKEWLERRRAYAQSRNEHELPEQDTELTEQEKSQGNDRTDSIPVQIQ